MHRPAGLFAAIGIITAGADELGSHKGCRVYTGAKWLVILNDIQMFWCGHCFVPGIPVCLGTFSFARGARLPDTGLLISNYQSDTSLFYSINHHLSSTSLFSFSSNHQPYTGLLYYISDHQ